MTLPDQRRETAAVLHADGFEIRAINEDSRSVDYICSTSSVDAHGTRIEQNWRLDRYNKNPVVLMAHDCDDIPIGLASNVRVMNGALVATVTFATEDINPEAEQCWRAVKARLLRGISVGFKPHAYRWEMDGDREIFVLDDNELLELSVTPVPSNPDALALRAADTATLQTLRAEAQAKRAKPENPPMKELEELRAALSAKDSELAVTRATEAKLSADLASTRAAADKAAADLNDAVSRAALLTAEAERLGKSNADLAERAAKAEDALLRSSVEARVGKDVDPAEVEHLVALRKAAPDLYEAEMKRRSASGRNDALTEQILPADAPEQRSVAGNPIDNLNKALARHLPKE